MKKAIGMFVALILALGMTGVAFAQWNETLHITGTVNTGTLDIEWSEYGSWDTEPPEKDVSSITCVIDEADPNNLIVTVTNAYPCIDYYNLVDIHNCGTIPVHINTLTVDNPNAEITVDISLRPYPLAVEGQLPMELPVQLHQGETIYALIHVHVEQIAAEGAMYTFTAQIVADLWNA